MDYFEVLLRDFTKESDRAAAILVASAADELLVTLVAARLAPSSSSTDDLFDGPNAPLGTFSARIEMAYRLGLISVKFARDLHIIRRIRNDFAHNIQGCSFEDARVKSRILELSNSHGIIRRSRHKFPKEPSPREAFLEAASWMVYHLAEWSKSTEALAPRPEECGYSYAYPIDEVPAPLIAGAETSKSTNGESAAQPGVGPDDRSPSAPARRSTP